MALFPRCNNPVPVVGRHGVTLVGCHSCIQCRVAAQEHLCKILEVEASKHKYVEFLTNTYDDKHLPYIDTSYMYPFGYAIRVPNRVIKKQALFAGNPWHEYPLAAFLEKPCHGN